MATSSQAKDKAVKATYTVISPLNHDKEHYAPGDPVELTEAQARPLLGHTVEVPKGTTAAG